MNSHTERENYTTIKNQRISMEWENFQNNICSLDLETNENGDIFALAAVFRDQVFQRQAPFNIFQVLKEFDCFVQEATFLLGHNIILHDLPHCQAINPNLALFDIPVIDTLFLSPLAYPENPYHRLVKNYKLLRDSLNDPLADAKLALSLFQDQWQALQEQQAQSGLLSFYYYAFSDNSRFKGLQLSLKAMGAEPLKASAAFDLLKQLTLNRVCKSAFDKVIISYLPNPEIRPALAYCLTWLRVAGGNSVLPPWVRLQFQDLAPAIRQLRDIPCQSPDCVYCLDTHNSMGQLKRFFGFDAFRAKPENEQGESLQQSIVDVGMSDAPLFAILPTGGGKSLCFQLPALVRYQRRGALTIVVSPLQALMKDQVDNLRNNTGSPSATALYGMLTAPERGEVLKSIQMGDIALLYVSPEQLRNNGFQKAIEHREIGCWVFDEAHCLSKWGHDFRPDYLYVARFIKEFAAKQQALLPPVQCFTATAKQDVKDEIIDYFRANLAQDLKVFEGGVERPNLQFEVQIVSFVEKYPRINSLLHERLDEHETGSAIIYCAKRSQTEDIAEFLQNQDWLVEAFHAGKNTAEKKHIQENFSSGNIRVITATNAFGMGIDKEDVRLVIHADIPGSLENYLQEAGRAGRDQDIAECILLFDENDIDTQFSLSASSQINQRDIAQILRGLRKTRKDRLGNVVITTGELLQNDVVETSFEAQDYNAGTKVVTAVSWLERAGFVERNENKTQVFQGRPLVKNLEEAEQKIEKMNLLSERQKKRWLAILETLINAECDEGFSADELAQLGEFATDSSDKTNETASQRVIRTLYDMSQAGIIQKNLLLTAYLRYKVGNPSISLLEQICQLERSLLKVMQEQAPDANTEEWQILSLRHTNQHLLDLGFDACNPEVLRLLLVSMSKDGQGLAANKGSLFLRHISQDQYKVKLNRGWQAMVETVRRRQTVSLIILNSLLQKIPDETKASADLLIEFSVEDLLDALKQDIEMHSVLKDPLAAVERGLNFLHEQRIITLQKGLAVFRQAMTIKVLPESKGRRYNKGDYEPLSQHYSERVFQIHVMNEYARIGLEKIGHALSFVLAYFSQDKSAFIKRYFKGRNEILKLATSQQSFQRIVSDLQNPLQQTLVASHENDNLLILAGPGSGKTRIVIHRCAYLISVKQVPAQSILVLCFNRNAAIELRQRLIDLVGSIAKAVTIQTYHGLSLRLTGHTLSGMEHYDTNTENLFQKMIVEAIELLTGKQDCMNVDSDEMRDKLLEGYRHILVDEYQDIDKLQYQLISALAGRNQDQDSQLTIMAVGDDDQNIYQFRGANIGFIRQFETDYLAGKHYLVENYRSSQHIIDVANRLIQTNQDRMKQNHPIRINQGRKNLAAGGRWEKLDPLVKGRVQILRCLNEKHQAVSLVQELQRLRQLDTNFDLSQCAILAVEWRLLNPLRAYLEAEDIPLSLAFPKGSQPSPFRIRENLSLLDALKQSESALCRASDWLGFLEDMPQNLWTHNLIQLLQQWQMETDNAKTSKKQLLEYLYESLAEQRRDTRMGDGVFLSTLHSIKGMEFSHVFILDGSWLTPASEEQRRLLYVGMTRAKETLCLMQREDLNQPYINTLEADSVFPHNSESEISSLLPKVNKKYRLLGLKDFDLSYAGSFTEKNSVHRILSNLTMGLSVDIRESKGKTVIQKDNITIAILSKKTQQEWNIRLDNIQSASIIAMISRYKTDNDEAYQSRCKVEKWEVPIIEVVIR